MLLSRLNVLGSSGLLLGLDLFGSQLLSLLLPDSLDDDSLIFELVTLDGEVELVVTKGLRTTRTPLQLLGDLSGLSVLSEEVSQRSLSSNPKNLGWHSGLSGTLSLTSSGVSS